MNRNFTMYIMVAGMFLVMATLPVLVETVRAQTASSYWITVDPTTPNSAMYGSVGRNRTLSFQAIWTYGNNSGQAINNANVTIDVNTTTVAQLKNLFLKTNATGFVSFSYSSSTPDILTFTPTELVTQDGAEWNSSLFQEGKNIAYGLRSESTVIYWDTFNVTLVSSDTNTLGITRIAVNVTHLLVPGSGLTFPESSSSPQIIVPKIVHNATLTIDGVKANESSAFGTYTANVSTWLPRAYVHAEVSQEGWTPAVKAFSITHNSNGSIWLPAGLLLLVCIVVLFLAPNILFRKSKGMALFSKVDFPVFGGLLLAIVSLVGLYWGVVGFDGVMHGFDWIWLGIIGLGSSIIGFAGSTMCLKRKNFAFVFFTMSASVVGSIVPVKASFDAYQLATPLVIIALPLVITIINAILVSNSENLFSMHKH